MISVRAEAPSDALAIRHIHLSCFPTAAEADLVEALRRDGDIVYSLVADRNGPVGHVLFSVMTAPFRALGLAPLAVLPDHQRQGVAASLIREGLARAAADGWDAVFVLGEPSYYGRFGFSPALAAGFQSPYAGPYLMAWSPRLELPVRSGVVGYARAFADLG